MSEATFFKLTHQGDFDGTTAISLASAELKTDDRRVYTAKITPPAAGVIPADFFGIFSANSPKLVGIAFSSQNPMNMARVIDAAGRAREQVNLRQDVQYVLLNGQDRLALLSKETTVAGEVDVEVFLVVNEVNEAQTAAWAAAHPPQPIHTHYRITRRGAPFALNAGNPGWQPAWVWNPQSQILEITDNTSNGPIPLTSLSVAPRIYGAYVAIRYSGSNNDGKFVVVENAVKSTFEAQIAMTDARWSRVQYLSHEDNIGLVATPVGGVIVCEIEVVQVEPADWLRARHAAADGGGNNL